ncbi:LOB domain-containing protein 37-like [Actinidia eriantha]|uniref:LOB domain-containing protein 37-like n=1 Tax=Actinidia eriantha TaxID=165200 RepID=UPI002588E714|nr:LOB domain-containing protein 37-like [Actinidia eriantha]
MSCNGCRVLRKGCNENCILRQSLQGIESPQAQSNATVFVAKFFGRAGLMSFLSAVSHSQRPALFQSLLFEACGRTVNPVNGAVGLLGTGNWNVCQAAVETVLRGGVLRPIQEFSGKYPAEESDDASDTNNIDFFVSRDLHVARQTPAADLDLHLTQEFPGRMTAGGRVKRRAETPSLNSDESETTSLESGSVYHQKNLHGRSETKILRLFF